MAHMQQLLSLLRTHVTELITQYKLNGYTDTHTHINT